jgi:hypothetical protein
MLDAALFGFYASVFQQLVEVRERFSLGENSDLLGATESVRGAVSACVQDRETHKPFVKEFQ